MTGAGTYIAELDLPGRAVGHVRAVVGRPRAHHRHRHRRRRAPRRAWSPCSPPPTSRARPLAPAPPAMPDDERRHDPAVPRRRRRALRRRDGRRRVSETRAQGADAAELVVVDYRAAPRRDRPRGGAATTTCCCSPRPAPTWPLAIPAPDVDDDPFAECEVVIEARMVNNRMASAPIEPRACAATWDGTAPHAMGVLARAPTTPRNAIAARLGLAPEQVRVIVPDVGGGFGGKLGHLPRGDPGRRGWPGGSAGPCAGSRPAASTCSRFGHGRGQVHTPRSAAPATARCSPTSSHVVQDCRRLPVELRRHDADDDPHHGERVLRPPPSRYRLRAVLTNTTPVGAFRGAGRPEAAAAIERHDRPASPPRSASTRSRCAGATSSPPTPSPTRRPIGDDLRRRATTRRRSTRRSRPPATTTCRAEQSAAPARRRRPALLGIGLAAYVEITNPRRRRRVRFGRGARRRLGDGAHRLVTPRPGPPHRVGHDRQRRHRHPDGPHRLRLRRHRPRARAAAAPAARARCRPAARRSSWPPTSSSTLARRRAADLLEANVDDVVLDADAGALPRGRHADPVRVSWAERRRRDAEPLAAEVDFVPDGATFPFGAHVAVVEVDPETGHVALVRLVAVDDAGRIINPLLVEGRSTAASRRASPRRCTRRSATTTTATR